MRQGMTRTLAASAAVAVAAVALLAGKSFAGAPDNAKDARYDDDDAAQRNQWATIPAGTSLNFGQSQYVVPAVPAPAPYALTGSNATEDTGSDYWAHQVPVQLNVGNAYVYVPVATR